MKHYVYRLRDPRTNEIRYIGQTKNLGRRKNNHLEDVFQGSEKPTTQWLKELIRLGLEPIMEVLDETDTENVNRLERLRYDEHLADGARLTNVKAPPLLPRGYWKR